MRVGDDRSSRGADEDEGTVDDLCILGCVWLGADKVEDGSGDGGRGGDGAGSGKRREVGKKGNIGCRDGEEEKNKKKKKWNAMAVL